MTTVTAVIPHWNRRDLLAALLKNLEEQTRRFDRVMVVDNGSTDGSAELAERAGARVIRMGSNQGFAAAVNRGVEAAETEWLAILNNDVTLDRRWLETLLYYLDERDGSRDMPWFGVGKVLRAGHPGMIDATFDEISRGGCAWRCGSARNDAAIWNEIQPIRIAPMTAALFRRRLFTDIGGLDEGFESYLEDVEFGLRCALAGRRGVYVPEAKAFHVGSATAGEWNKDTVRRIARNQILLARKHLAGCACWPMVAGQLLWGFVAFRHGRGLSYLRGKLEGFFASTERRADPAAAAVVRSVLEESEQRILELQRQTGFDPYWRAYFWLSRR